jgi:hypothetical protein
MLPRGTDTGVAILLSFNMTEESFKAIASLGSMDGFSRSAKSQVTVVRGYQTVQVIRPSKYTREQMLEKVARFPEIDPNLDQAEDEALDNSIYSTFTVEALGALREGRRRMIQGVSDESVDEYDPEFS